MILSTPASVDPINVDFPKVNLLMMYGQYGHMVNVVIHTIIHQACEHQSNTALILVRGFPKHLGQGYVLRNQQQRRLAQCDAAHGYLTTATHKTTQQPRHGGLARLNHQQRQLQARCDGAVSRLGGGDQNMEVSGWRRWQTCWGGFEG